MKNEQNAKLNEILGLYDKYIDNYLDASTQEVENLNFEIVHYYNEIHNNNKNDLDDSLEDKLFSMILTIRKKEFLKMDYKRYNEILNKTIYSYKIAKVLSDCDGLFHNKLARKIKISGKRLLEIYCMIEKYDIVYRDKYTFQPINKYYYYISKIEGKKFLEYIEDKFKREGLFMNEERRYVSSADMYYGEQLFKASRKHSIKRFIAKAFTKLFRRNKKIFTKK